MNYEPTQRSARSETTSSIHVGADGRCRPTQVPKDVDVPALRQRYRQERDKRIRKEGHAQYSIIPSEDEELGHSDFYLLPAPRNPIADDVDAAVLGGGFAGLVAAVALKQAGVTNLKVIEAGGDFGGTWYWNRYPGLQCDTESYVYLPLLEETNYVPTKKYCEGPEIFAHCQRIGRHFGLYDGALFGTTVRSLRWDDSIKRWRIVTEQGDEVRSRFVVMAIGLLNKPKLPGIPGIRSFKGHSFHTSRWDYKYTGGDSTGGLVKLNDKRVAIIGTGSTSIQVVPFLGQYAKHLYVFQRTPSYVSERDNRPTDPDWAQSLKRGWQDARRRNNAGTLMGFPSGVEDLVCDSWSEVSRNLQATLDAMGNPKLAPEKMRELREMEEFKVTQRVRHRIESIVTDKKTAEALKPWYRLACKRPCFNDEYIHTFNRPNVTLVDVSQTKGVELINERGLVANGIDYDVDCIVYSTGYEFTGDPKGRYGLDAIEGRDCLSLYDYWADGFSTLHGVMSHGFPNLFFTGYTQVAIGNVSAMYEQQATHIAYITRQAMAGRAATVEPSQEGQDAWGKIMRESAIDDAALWRECTPGHYNGEGAESYRSPFGDLYGPGFYAFDALLNAWRDKGDLQGLVLAP
jgi:cyclohexanone monooxygenase